MPIMVEGKEKFHIIFISLVKLIYFLYSYDAIDLLSVFIAKAGRAKGHNNTSGDLQYLLLRKKRMSCSLLKPFDR